MKTAILIAVICCLGLTQALTQDDIKKFGAEAEKVVKCVIDNHGDINEVEDLVEKLEGVAAGNGKIEELRNKVAGFLKALGFEVDDSRGFFGLAVDVFEGIKQAYKEGKDDEVLQFVDGLLQVVPENAWDEAGKVCKQFMEDEKLGACAPKGDKRRGFGQRKDMTALYDLLKRALFKRRK